MVDVVGTTYTIAENANGPIVADFQVELENFAKGNVTVTGFIDGQEKAKFVVNSKGKIEWYINRNFLHVKGFGEIANYDTRDNKAPWWEKKDDVNGIEIEEGITGIGKNAFKDMGSYVIIAASVEHIEKNALPKTIKRKEENTNKEKNTYYVTMDSFAESYLKENGYDYYWYPLPVTISCESILKEGSNNEALYQVNVIATVQNECNLSKVYCNPWVPTSEKNAEIIWNTDLDESFSLSNGSEIHKSFDIKVENLDKYRDGGKISYNVDLIVNSNGTQYLLKEQSFELYFDAVNGESNELDFERDVWHFHNTGEAPTPISAEDKRRLLSDLDLRSYKQIQNEITKKNGTKRGSCYGLSAIVILNKMHAFDKDYNLAEETYQGNKSWITYYYLVWFLPKQTSSTQAFMEKDKKEQIQELVQETEQVKEGGAPVLISFGRDKIGAHAVVGYKVEDTDKEIDGVVFNKRILTYDCNAYDDKKKRWENETALYVNTETGEWRYWGEPYEENGKKIYAKENFSFGSGLEGSYLEGSENDISVINEKDYEANYEFSPEIFLGKETSVQVQNGDNIFLASNQGVNVQNLIRYYDDNVLETPSSNLNLHIVLPNPNSPVSLSTQDGKPAALDITYNSSDAYYRVEADLATGVEYGTDQSVILKGNQGSYTISTAYNNYSEEILPIYTVTGDTTGDVCIRITDTGITVNGENSLEGNKVVAENQQGYTKTVMLDESTEVEINGENKEGMIIKEIVDSTVQFLEALKAQWAQISPKNKKIFFGSILIIVGLLLLGGVVWSIEKKKKQRREAEYRRRKNKRRHHKKSDHR